MMASEGITRNRRKHDRCSSGRIRSTNEGFMATVEYQNLIQRLKILFPNLEPITNTPPLLLVRGIGLAMAGHRDVHPTPGSYIKTLSFVIFWIVPLFRIRSYRLLDATAPGRLLRQAGS